MRLLSRLSTLGLPLLLWLAVPGPASAARVDPLGFHLARPAMVAHENAGSALITVERTETRRAAQVGYIALGPGHRCGRRQCSAQYGWDFGFVKGTLDFPAGVAREAFRVPLVDHHAFTLPQTVRVSLFGGWPNGLAFPSTSVLTIRNDDPVAPAWPVPRNATAGGSQGAGANPLVGQRFFVDPGTDIVRLAGRHRVLRVLAKQPWVERFGSFSGRDVGMAVSHYLARAAVQRPLEVPMLSTYRIVDGHCRNWADPPADQASYHRFIQRFARGLGSYRAVLFLEMDSLITVGCLSSPGVGVRMGELRDAISILRADCPRLVIYLDAGAADAATARATAGLLLRAGVAQIQGFFTNSTHFDWTSREIRYGDAISRMTGGKHFVINTSGNGRGPLRPPDPVHQGNEVLCNPPGRGLGPLPSANTGYRSVDAFAWILHPGESTGRCGAGAPRTGVFWPAYGEMLVHNAVFAVR